MSDDALNFDNPPNDPLPTMGAWLESAAAHSGLPNPNAMSLATVDADGKPSIRTVLLKKLDHDGAVFFTNTHSRKGIELSANPQAALLFHWDVLGRQIRIEGEVARTSSQEDDEYFASRPVDSRISACASPQSEPVEDRAHLEELFEQTAAKYGDQDVPRPPHWGGYRVALQRIEFWRLAENRLHDRIVYTRDGDSWQVKRLAP